MTLNVLLSSAQFEREFTSERILQHRLRRLYRLAAHSQSMEHVFLIQV
jgi:hypothetical protein